MWQFPYCGERRAISANGVRLEYINPLVWKTESFISDSPFPEFVIAICGAMQRLIVVPTPTTTALSHAVRWIVSGKRVLSFEDEHALRDHPVLDDPIYDEAKQSLLLALRHGLVHASGNLEVYDKRYSVFKNGLPWGFGPWKEYLQKYQVILSEIEKGYKFIGHSVDIDNELWDKRYIIWNSNCLHYIDGDIQCRFLTVHVSTNELFHVFSNKSKELKSTHVDENNLTPKEKTSLLKLVIGMAVKGYVYDPENPRNKATAEIEADLQLLGIPLSRDTILKWLREGAKVLPPADK